MILPTTKDPRTIFYFCPSPPPGMVAFTWGGPGEVVKGTILLLFSFSLFLAGRWCIFIARLGEEEEDVHRTHSLTTIQSVFYSRRDNMYAARAKNTQLDTLWADWLAQRSTCPFRFPFLFLFCICPVVQQLSSCPPGCWDETTVWMDALGRKIYLLLCFYPRPSVLLARFKNLF